MIVLEGGLEKPVLLLKWNKTQGAARAYES